MSAIIRKETDRVWRLRIGGVLKKTELDAAQDEARQEFKNAGKIKLLLVLEAFIGWEKGADWEDMSFLADHGDDIEKIAIVAPRSWETETMMFVGAGFRRTQVQFFVPALADQARAWLVEDAAMQPQARSDESSKLTQGETPAERPDA